MGTGFSRVRFNNFRNIEPREIKWFPGLNLLSGLNGAGKTNILEGINIISGWGPLESGTRIKSLPAWGSGTEDVQLTGQLCGEYKEIIKVKISGKCMLRVDDKAIKASDLRWKVPVLSFLPCDMAIMEGSASYRRRLLDMLLAILVPSYAERIHSYRRGVRQKAALLARGVSPDAADRALLPLASWIWRMREEAVSLLSDCLSAHDELLPSKTELFLLRGGAGFYDNTEDDYLKAADMNRTKEMALKTPLVGPHRDDLLITARGKPAAAALSRGLRRRAAIALILAASDGIFRKLGKEPVLLLDEVTSELDRDGRKILFDNLSARKGQVFAATAEPDISDFPGEVHIVVQGRVSCANEDR